MNQAEWTPPPGVEVRWVTKKSGVKLVWLIHQHTFAVYSDTDGPLNPKTLDKMAKDLINTKLRRTMR